MNNLVLESFYDSGITGAQDLGLFLRERTRREIVSSVPGTYCMVLVHKSEQAHLDYHIYGTNQYSTLQ